MFACCTLLPVGQRVSDGSAAHRGRANSNAVGRVILSSPAAITELPEAVKARRSGSVLSPGSRRTSVSIQNPVLLQMATGLTTDRPVESARSFMTSRRLRRPSMNNQREGSRSTRVASIVVPPILPGRPFRDPTPSPTQVAAFTAKRDSEGEDQAVRNLMEAETRIQTELETPAEAEDDEGPMRTFHPPLNSRLSPTSCCWRTSSAVVVDEQIVDEDADLKDEALSSLVEPAIIDQAQESVPERLIITRPLTPVSASAGEQSPLDAIVEEQTPVSSPEHHLETPRAETPVDDLQRVEPSEVEAGVAEKVLGRTRTRLAPEVTLVELERATVRKASLSAKPSSDDTPLAIPLQVSTKPATKRKAKAPPGAKSAGAVGGLVTKDKTKMVDLLPPKDKKNLLGVCTFVRNSIDIEPASDNSVADRDKAFLLWLFLFAVKAAVSGKQHPVATVCAHASDHAAGDLVTDKAKKAAPKVHFLIKAVCKPVLSQLESPDSKLSLKEVATDIERSVGVLMGEKPAGWKERLGYIDGAVSTWSWPKAKEMAEANVAEYDKLAEKLWDALDACRQPGQTGFTKITEEVIQLFQR